VDIADPSSAALPAGYGDEDPVTFDPILPADRTFASVLQGVDEIHFTTFVPGFCFGFTNFVTPADNRSVSVVPEPGMISTLAGVGLLALRRRA